MTPFIAGFSDELEKIAIASALARGGAGAVKTLIKNPGKVLTGLFIGAGAYEGAKQARKAGKTRKGLRPSRAYYTNYSRALGVPRGRMSRLKRRRLFAHARAVPGRYRK